MKQGPGFILRSLVCFGLGLCLLLAPGCGTEEDAADADAGALPDSEDSDAAGDVDTQDDGALSQDAGPMEKVFSFAVVADPHVTNSGKNHDRLVATVAWLNANAEARGIELVLVLGDIAWGKGLPIARADLDALTMPWVPIIGDNVIVSDNELQWNEAFTTQFDALTTELGDFIRAPMPGTDTKGKELWLQNAAFSHRGLRFIGLDFNARVKHFIRSEQGSLYDFAGGTWPFLKGEIDSLGERKQESVLMYSHIPMHLSPGGFDDKEMEAITALTGPKSDLIYANLAGHYHFEMVDEPKDAGYVMFSTDATWDDEVRVRVIDVSTNAVRFDYSHELVAVTWTGP